MKTIDFSYFIERYNSGEMDLIEKKWFEKELHGNDTLQKEVKLRKRVDNALIRHDLISLRNKLTDLEKTRKEKQVATAGRKAVAIRFAAAIASLMVLGSIYLLTKGPGNRDRIYNSYFQAYDLSNNSRSAEAGRNAEFESALQLYRDMNFAGAASKFRDYLKHHPQSMEAQLVYGVSEMENFNYPSAKMAFRTVIDQNNNLYIDMAQWYLALCCIKTGDNNEAVKQLDAIANSESSFKARARKLMKIVK